MGAGISTRDMNKIIYRNLKKISRDLEAKGIPNAYKNLELRGKNFVVYMATVGPASNGERFGWIVLRYNATKRPESAYRSEGDVDYTNFHTRTIPEARLGDFDAGVRKVLETT